MTSSRSLVVVLLFSIASPLPAEELQPSPTATPDQVRQTVDRAVAYLQTESGTWLSTRKCAACHHAGMPLWALSVADQRGYTIDRQYLADRIEQLLGNEENLFGSRIFPNPADPPDPRPSGRGLNMGLPFLAVAARSLPKLTDGQAESLRKIDDLTVQKQQPDGSWEFFAGLRRPPINEVQSTDVAWVLMSLEAGTTPDSPEAQKTALANGMRWLATAPPSELHQDKALKLILGARTGASRESLQGTIDELLALQRVDGGWTQTVKEPRSDAFATGQTLYGLALLGFTANDPAVRRAIDFLVATQSPEGKWAMVSRSTPNGEEGSSKLLTPIECAAASWAVLGLVETNP
ncbi:MAG: prenyltransferase/squalene oxidase repeat-containing protein [Planctomycetaceae bacterium]